MEKNNIVNVVLEATVMIIIVGSLLIPFINDVTTETTTYTNEGYDFQVTANPQTALTYTLGEDNALMLNGENLNLATSSTYAGISSSTFGGQWVNGASFWVTTPAGAFTNNITAMTINPDGSWSFTNDGTEITSTVEQKAEDTFAIVPNGEYVAYRPSGSTNFIAPAGQAVPVVINYGQAVSGANTYPLFARANLIDGAIVEEYAYIYIDGVKTDVDVNWTVSGSSSAVVNDGICTYSEFNLTFALEEYTVAGRYIVLADKEFSVSTPIDNELNLLLKVIPVLVILAIIVATVSIIYNRER